MMPAFDHLTTSLGAGPVAGASTQESRTPTQTGKVAAGDAQPDDKPVELAVWVHDRLARGCNDKFEAPIALMETCRAGGVTAQEAGGLQRVERREEPLAGIVVIGPTGRCGPRHEAHDDRHDGQHAEHARLHGLAHDAAPVEAPRSRVLGTPSVSSERRRTFSGWA